MRAWILLLGCDITRIFQLDSDKDLRNRISGLSFICQLHIYFFPLRRNVCIEQPASFAGGKEYMTICLRSSTVSITAAKG